MLQFLPTLDQRPTLLGVKNIYEPDETWEPFITSFEPKGFIEVSSDKKHTQLEVSFEII